MTEEKAPEQRSSMGIVFGLIIPLIGIEAIVFALFVVLPSISEQQQPVCSNFSSKIHADIPIYSTEDGTAVKGSFFLGCGYINTYLVYFVYTGDDTNGFQRHMLNAENVFVFRDSEIPHMVTKTKYEMRVMDGLTGTKICTPIDIVELHVPKNTLIKDVDASGA